MHTHEHACSYAHLCAHTLTCAHAQTDLLRVGNDCNALQVLYHSQEFGICNSKYSAWQMRPFHNQRRRERPHEVGKNGDTSFPKSLPMPAAISTHDVNPHWKGYRTTWDLPGWSHSGVEACPFSLTDSWKERLVTRGQARESADPPLDRREEYFHSFKKAFLKAPWAGKKKSVMIMSLACPL